MYCFRLRSATVFNTVLALVVSCSAAQGAELSEKQAANPVVDAEKVVAVGLARAKAEKKKVLIHLGAPS